MRIYGGKDYYDVALSMGIDPRIVLLRGKSKSIGVEKAGGTLLNRYLEEKQVSYNAYGVKRISDVLPLLSVVRFIVACLIKVFREA